MSNADNLAELFGRDEELHDDLKPHVHAHEGMTWLHHPLIIMPFFAPPMHALANRSYLEKKAKRDAALAKKDWSTVLALTERPYRWTTFHEVWEDISDRKEYWELVSWLLTDTENQWEVQDEIVLALIDPPRGEFLEYRPIHIMDQDERDELDAMEDRINVFRGCQERNRDGVSWTIDPAKAVWFAKRFCRGNDRPLLRIGYVDKHKVIAYLKSRNESEIVCLPEDVEVVEEKVLSIRKGGED